MMMMLEVFPILSQNNNGILQKQKKSKKKIISSTSLGHLRLFLLQAELLAFRIFSKESTKAK